MYRRYYKVNKRGNDRCLGIQYWADPYQNSPSDCYFMIPITRMPDDE